MQMLQQTSNNLSLVRAAHKLMAELHLVKQITEMVVGLLSMHGCRLGGGKPPRPQPYLSFQLGLSNKRQAKCA